MRFSGAIFAVSLLFFSLLCIAWFTEPASEGDVTTVTDLHADDKPSESIQDILSGDIKRAPKKNPDMGHGHLRGAVIDTMGKPVEGAMVQVTPVDRNANILDRKPPITHYWEIETDVRGTFALRNLPEGTVVVSAAHRGRHGVAMAAIADPGPAQTALLVVEESVARRGTVRDGAGAPVAGARIIPIAAAGWNGDPFGYRYVSVTTGDDGNFLHPLLPEGTWNVLAVAPGFAPARATLNESEATPVQLGKGEALQGQVVQDNDGRPLSNARVLMVAQDEPAEFHVLRTNGQGFFTADALRPTAYTLRMDDVRYVGETTTILEDSSAAQDAADTPASQRTALTLHVQDAASIRGRVLAIAADYGIPGTRVEAFFEQDARPVAAAVTDQAGYYHIKGLAGGQYRLASPGTAEQAITPEGDATVDVEPGARAAGPVFRAESGETFSGIVTDSRGEAVSEANVFMHQESYPGKARGTVAGKDGSFRFTGVHRNDQVTLWAEHSGRQSERFGPLTAGEGGLGGIRLQVSPLGVDE